MLTENVLIICVPCTVQISIKLLIKITIYSIKYIIDRFNSDLVEMHALFKFTIFFYMIKQNVVNIPMEITKTISQESIEKSGWTTIIGDYCFHCNNFFPQTIENFKLVIQLCNFVTFARFADKNNHSLFHTSYTTAHRNLYNALKQTTIKWSLAPIELPYSSGFTLDLKICIISIKKSTSGLKLNVNEDIMNDTLINCYWGRENDKRTWNCYYQRIIMDSVEWILFQR